MTLVAAAACILGACPSGSFAEDGWPVHMAQTLKQWTLDEVHSLPDDGNKYELIRGQLFVTPAPTPDHELIAARLDRILNRYVEAQGLGDVFRPRAVLRHAGSEAEPDIMVRREPKRGTPWELWPIPILVVEIISPYTRRRDLTDKRSFYLDAGVAEYWIVDPEQESIRSFTVSREDIAARDELQWHPLGATEPLLFRVPELFR